MTAETPGSIERARSKKLVLFAFLVVGLNNPAIPFAAMVRAPLFSIQSLLCDLTFAEAVKTFLRQDPDVIMIGEIRDPDTAKYAIQASQTGHLVFFTLHTNDAPGAVVRMLEMGMEPYLVASTLQLVIAQRLLRTTCKQCGEFRLLNEREALYAKRNGLKIEKVFGGKGCRDCLNTGYKGRVGVYEIMLVTPELQELIALKTPTQKIREKAIEQGMKTLLQEAIRLVNEGKTTLEEIESSIG